MTVRLIGGEMLNWSDLDGRHGPGPVRGAALSPLLALARGRTLVAGPHHPDLLDGLPDGDLTLLVRGVPDADALAERYRHRPRITVCCGGPEKLPAQPPYDTVIALDGLRRLASAEGAQLPWAEGLELLLAALRPGGRLLLGMENLLGLHRLVALPRERTDTDWGTPEEYDPSRPAGLRRVLAYLDGAGLTVTDSYAGFPGAYEPTVLLGADVLADAAITGFLESTLAVACAPAEAVLTDPVRLATDALRHGMAGELAPGWVLLARRRADDGSDDPDRGSGARPAAGADPPGGQPPAAVLATAEPTGVLRPAAAGGWLRRPAGSAADGVAVPAGPTLWRVLLTACLRHDLPAVRDLLRDWQAGNAAGVPADRLIVEPGGRLVPLAPAGDPAAALRRCAALLLAGDHPHPWPAATGEAELAAILAGMAGRDPASAEPAGAGPGPVVPAGREPDPAAGSAPGAPGERERRPDMPAFRELVRTRDRLVAELAAARAAADAWERLVAERERSLVEARRTIDLLSAAGPARAGRALLGGARAARGSARSVVRRWSGRG
ncbi:hypothetical protein [Plantactinospora sp. KBS50]|uniref:hypothetical protein n=1 Tax=Plantactinospora sp. KBS50 TaxID=2024580 RepID=UPI000BAB2233|nr:hypothetical protein [Plantactinospora sp. KBS50]ASW55316.1 hypothetical protein CIK06_15760 [Plantactinospora sp. KBS50]